MTRPDGTRRMPDASSPSARILAGHGSKLARRWEDLPQSAHHQVAAYLWGREAIALAQCRKDCYRLITQHPAQRHWLLGPMCQGPLPKQPHRDLDGLLGQYGGFPRAHRLMQQVIEHNKPINEDTLFEEDLQQWRHREAQLGHFGAALAAQRILYAQRQGRGAELDLCGLTFSSLPTCCQRLTGLRGLYLRNCVHLVALPGDLSSLVALEMLDLTGCARLADLPESFGQLAALRTLSLAGCPRLGRLPGTFGHLALNELCMDLRTGGRDLTDGVRALYRVSKRVCLGVSNDCLSRALSS